MKIKFETYAKTSKVFRVFGIEGLAASLYFDECIVDTYGRDVIASIILIERGSVSGELWIDGPQFWQLITTGETEI
jgi:hypothetical protein